MAGKFQQNRVDGGNLYMQWKEKDINIYPNVILSDCQIAHIEMEGDNIAIDFSKYGFFRKDNLSNKYYRTDAGKIVVEQCDVDNVSIKEIRNHQLSDDVFCNSMYDVEPSVFSNNINTGKWRFEIIEEYYASGSALYIGQIREDDKKFKCCIKVQYKDLIYLWNEIRYDYPF